MAKAETATYTVTSDRMPWPQGTVLTVEEIREYGPLLIGPLIDAGHLSGPPLPDSAPPPPAEPALTETAPPPDEQPAE